MVLQLSLPLLVGLFNLLQYAVHSLFAPAQDPEERKHRQAKVIAKYLGFINCLYMSLVRYTVGAFICIELNDAGIQVCDPPQHGTACAHSRAIPARI